MLSCAVVARAERQTGHVAQNPALRVPRRRSRSGLYALKVRVKVRGLQAIDRRTAAARAWKSGDTSTRSSSDESTTLWL